MATRRKTIHLSGAAAPAILDAKKHQRSALAHDRAAQRHYRLYVAHTNKAAHERVLRDKAIRRAMRHRGRG